MKSADKLNSWFVNFSKQYISESTFVHNLLFILVVYLILQIGSWMYQGWIHAFQNACSGCRILQSFGYNCPNQQIELHNHCWSVHMKMSFSLWRSICWFWQQYSKDWRILQPGQWTGILRSMFYQRPNYMKRISGTNWQMKKRISKLHWLEIVNNARKRTVYKTTGLRR